MREYIRHPFNGSLTCPTDRGGTPLGIYGLNFHPPGWRTFPLFWPPIRSRPEKNGLFWAEYFPCTRDVQKGPTQMQIKIFGTLLMNFDFHLPGCAVFRLLPLFWPPLWAGPWRKGAVLGYQKNKHPWRMELPPEHDSRRRSPWLSKVSQW